MFALGPLLQAHTTILRSQTLAIPPGTSFPGSVKYLSNLISAALGVGRDPIFPSLLTARPPIISLPPPDVSFEYELVTFMAVFLGGLRDVHIRHFLGKSSLTTGQLSGPIFPATFVVRWKNAFPQEPLVVGSRTRRV